MCVCVYIYVYIYESYIYVCIYIYIYIYESETQSHPTFCDPMDCTVHGILQARIPSELPGKLHVCVYIYIYIYMYVYVCICIYIYMFYNWKIFLFSYLQKDLHIHRCIVFIQVLLVYKIYSVKRIEEKGVWHSKPFFLTVEVFHFHFQKYVGTKLC